MKKITKNLAIAVVATSLLSSCATDGSNDSVRRRDFTTILGAIGGGILGSNVGKGKGRMVGAAVGALAGAAAGGWLGENLDNPKDRTYYYTNTQTSLEKVPVGQSMEWKNPETGSYGFTTPTRTYKAEGRYCREYTQIIIVGGKKQEAYGKACRQPDGTWEIQQ